MLGSTRDEGRSVGGMLGRAMGASVDGTRERAGGTSIGTRGRPSVERTRGRVSGTSIDGLRAWLTGT